MFTDWCAATGHQEFPAESATGEPHQPAPGTMTIVEAALRALPSHGWTQGMFGRQDRCLPVMSQLAGVPYQDLATLTAGDITLLDGTATIRSAAGAWTVHPGDDALVCGPCTITRWIRVVDLAVTKITTGSVAAAVDSMKNTVEELDRYDPAIEAFLDQVLTDYGLAAVGWSAAYDPALRNAISRNAARVFTGYFINPGRLDPVASDLITHRGMTLLPITADDAVGTL